MTWAKLFMCLIASAAILAACTDPASEDVETSLQTVTASTIHVADAGDIEILNRERLASKWVWEARVGGKAYTCDADDRMRLPACQAIEQGASNER